MARIRTIKPEFWTSEQVVECCRNARLLFIGIWNFSDDAGRMALSARRLKMQIFPGDDDISSENILGMVAELARNDLVTLYVVDNVEYLQVNGWKHQRIDKAQPSKIPAPIAAKRNTIPRAFQERSQTEGNGREGKGKESKQQQQSLDSTPRAPNLADPPFAAAAFSASPDDGDGTDLKALEAKLRAAAGYENNPAPSLHVVGPILNLMAEGFDLEAEILPVIKGKAPLLHKAAQSWGYFVASIREQRDRTNAATAKGKGGQQAAKPSLIPKDPNAGNREYANLKMVQHYGSPDSELALRKAMMALWCGNDKFGSVKPYTCGAVFPKGWIAAHFANRQNVIALSAECYRSANLSGILNAAGMDERAYYALVDSETAKYYAASLTGQEYFEINETDAPYLSLAEEWPETATTFGEDANSEGADMDAA